MIALVLLDKNAEKGRKNVSAIVLTSSEKAENKFKKAKK